jgi:hypothetical protein
MTLRVGIATPFTAAGLELEHLMVLAAEINKKRLLRNASTTAGVGQ